MVILKKLTIMIGVFALAACANTAVSDDKTKTNNANANANGINSKDFSTFNTVHFDFDRSSTKSEDMSKLKSQASYLKNNSNAKVIIEGHTDQVGTDEYNLALGERRATAVRNYLSQNGIDANRIETRSYGKSKLISNSMDAKARAENRRAVTVVK